MRGRFCLKSTDGFWLRVCGDRDEYITDPAPPEPPTSFFGKQAAADAATHFRLPGKATVLARLGFESVEEMRAAGNETPYWEIVPDPNP